MTDDERYHAIEDFTNNLLHECKKAIQKAGGDYDVFHQYLQYKEAIGTLDEALTLALSEVETIKYKGCF